MNKTTLKKEFKTFAFDATRTIMTMIKDSDVNVSDEEELKSFVRIAIQTLGQKNVLSEMWDICSEGFTKEELANQPSKKEYVQMMSEKFKELAEQI